MTHTIDINCDMGEGFGPYTLGRDADVMPYITSANVACGFHAGDPLVMYRTVALCLKNDVAVGAHPSYRDLYGFGRRVLQCTEEEIYGDVLYQIGALDAVCRALGMRLHHVKPHGALYNEAARNPEVAHAICRAVRAFDPELPVYVLPGSHLQHEAEAMGLPVALEAFADRAYNPDGTLVDRRRKGAVLHDPQAVAERVLRMVTEGKVQAIDGTDISFRPHTICVHGDTPGAVELCRAIAEALAAHGVRARVPNLKHEGDAMIG